MPRLFLALNLPDELKTALSLLPGDVPGARWLDTEQYHLTLKYFGDMPSSQIERLHAVLDRLEFSVLNLQVKGIGLFPLRGDPETLWVGVVPSPPLLRMQKHIERRLMENGIPKEGRNYFPHISLARLREATLPYLGAYIALHSNLDLGDTPFTSYSLYSSHGTSMGSHYVEEFRFQLYGVTGEEDDVEF